MDRPAQPDAAHDRSFGQWLRDMPRWKKVALGVASAAVVIGAVGMLVQGGDATVATGGSAGRSDLTADLVREPAVGETAPPPPAGEPASKGVFRLGFSFVAGFCIGSFVRAAVRLVAIAFGFWLVMTIVLSHYGLVVVDWHAIGGVWDRFAASIADQWGDWQTFLTGSLPSAGLAIAGLAIGLKRH
jgi:uncharacterized membrane protein (Fun14 family)